MRLIGTTKVVPFQNRPEFEFFRCLFCPCGLSFQKHGSVQGLEPTRKENSLAARLLIRLSNTVTLSHPFGMDGAPNISIYGPDQ